MKVLNKIIILAMSVLVGWSCSNEEYEKPITGEGDVKLQIGINVRTPQPIELRSSTEPGKHDENTVETFHVFMFDKSGTRVESETKIVGGAGDDYLELTTLSGEYKVCVVTNHDYQWDLIRTYDDLSTLVLNSSNLPVSNGGEDGQLDEDSPRIIMYGEKTMTLAPTNDVPHQINLDVERTVSKINLTIHNELSNGERYQIKKVSLHSVNNSWLTPQPHDYTPQASSTFVIYDNVTGIEPSAQDKLEPPTQYLYENRAGNEPAQNADQRLKGDGGEKIEGTGKYPAYVLIEGNYIYTNGVTKAVSQKVYLGKDNHSDFNVGRNESHRYTIKITGEATTDTRVESRILSELNFISSSSELQDAHFVRHEIKIKAKNIANWEVSSNAYWLTLRTDLTEFHEQGYWIDTQAGASSIESSENGNEITIYAFIQENIDRPAQSRTATLTLKEKGTNGPETKYTVTQLPIKWYSTFGSERIEEHDPENPNGYQWGFNWNKKTVFTHDNGWNLFESGWYRFVAGLYRLTEDGDEIVNLNPWYQSPLKVTIDYSKASGTDNATDMNDGLQNSWNLYNLGPRNVSTLENYLKDSGNFNENTSGNMEDNIGNYAAMMCLKKNMFSLQAAQDENGEIYYRPFLREENANWYLPAYDEYNQITEDEEYKLNGIYWTSTAETGSANSYSFTAEGGTASATRNNEYKIRAVRQSPW